MASQYTETEIEIVQRFIGMQEELLASMRQSMATFEKEAEEVIVAAMNEQEKLEQERRDIDQTFSQKIETAAAQYARTRLSAAA
jgi:hypothetical protein